MTLPLQNNTLDDISAVIGFSATLRLVAWFGDGNNLYVPIEPDESQIVVKLIGLSAAQRLSAAWPGEHLAVPRLRDHEDDVRKRYVARLVERGFSTREIASLCRTSERRVQQICRELEAAGLVPVLGPAKSRAPRGERKKALAELAGESALKNWA